MSIDVVSVSAGPRSRSLFELLLRPRSVAIVGASTNPESLGGRPLGFLRSYGYPGAIYPINANHSVVQGVSAYASVLDVGEPIDLALVAVRAELVPLILRDCAKAGVGAAIVVSSGFGEGQGAGEELAHVVRDIAASSGMRIMGPNCEGLASLPASAPLTFSPVLDIEKTGHRLASGSIAVISQSGGVGFAIAGWGAMVGLGFSYILTTGNEVDVDCVEIADGLLDDEQTSVIVLVLEGVHDLERLRALARRTQTRGKRLVVAKLGRTTAGRRGALAHTRHDSGPQSQYSALFEQEGVVVAEGMEDLIDVLQAVGKSRPAKGRRLGVMTTSGGSGVWLTDACEEAGYQIPVLSEATSAKLAELMPAYGSPTNPVDLTAQFLTGGSFAAPLATLIDSGEVDVAVLATSLSAAGRLNGDKAALAELIDRSPIPIAIYSYTNPAPSSVEILNDLGVPWYTDSTRAARGLAAMIPRG